MFYEEYKKILLETADKEFKHFQKLSELREKYVKQIETSGEFDKVLKKKICPQLYKMIRNSIHENTLENVHASVGIVYRTPDDMKLFAKNQKCITAYDNCAIASAD